MTGGAGLPFFHVGSALLNQFRHPVGGAGQPCQVALGQRRVGVLGAQAEGVPFLRGGGSPGQAGGAHGELMSTLPVPTLSLVIGEGGSGGALAIGLTDRILMLEHAIYSVISPRGCASILWKDPEAEQNAAKQLKMTALDLKQLGICDEIIPEAVGGAHRGFTQTAAAVAETLGRHLDELSALSVDDLLQARYDKFRNIGHLEQGG